MSLKRLPRDDLAVAKPVGPRALALVSDFTRFDPPDFDSPQPDQGVASRHEALREDAWLHVLISRLKPIAHLVVPAQPRPAWSFEHNLGIVQREKLVNVVPPIEEFDPSARPRRSVATCSAHYLLGLASPLRGEIPVVHARDQRGHQSAVLLLPRESRSLRGPARAAIAPAPMQSGTCPLLAWMRSSPSRAAWPSQLSCADRCRRRTVPAARRTRRPRASCARRHPRSSREGSVAAYLR
jgi:hypothetical protein